MAYIEFPETGGALLDRRPAFAPRGFVKPAQFASAQFTPLEWQVVAIARNDSLSSIQPAGPIVRAFRWLFGLNVSNALSDARLEALRRIAVVSWRRGYSVAEDDVRAFLTAGFTLDHYDILLTRINALRAALPQRFRK